MDNTYLLIGVVISGVVAAIIAAFVGAHMGTKTFGDRALDFVDLLHDNPNLQSAIDALWQSAPVAVQEAGHEVEKFVDAADELTHDIVDPVKPKQ